MVTFVTFRLTYPRTLNYVVQFLTSLAPVQDRHNFAGQVCIPLFPIRDWVISRKASGRSPVGPVQTVSKYKSSSLP